MQIHEWVKRSESFAILDFKSLCKPLNELNDRLTQHNHVGGHALNIQDLAAWATLRGNRIAHSSIKKTPNHVTRWYNHIESSNSWISQALAEFSTHMQKDAPHSVLQVKATTSTYQILKESRQKILAHNPRLGDLET